MIKLNGLSRTAVWTLRPRHDEHLRPDRLFDDPMAVEWYRKVADQEYTDTWYNTTLQMTIAIRAKVYDDAVVRFMATHESPVVVELGAGLSTRYYRLAVSDHSSWIELDLPEIIALRRELEPETASRRFIESSILDFSWLQQIPEAPPESVLFVAEGLFMFFGVADRQRLVEQMRRAFPGATLLLDVPGKTAQHGEAAIAAAQGIQVEWFVDDEQDVAAQGLSLVHVWPVLEQYPERTKLLLGDAPFTKLLRNATLIVEANLCPWQDIGLVEGSTAPPIFYRGNSFRAAKQFVYGTHRACPPEETLARIEPTFNRAGITRIADITGLDRIGIPVTLAIRPNAPTMSNSTGKGFTIAAATVSGAMEGIEIYHAENARLETIYKTYNEIAEKFPVMPLETLPRIKGDLFNADLPEHWTLGWDIIQQQEVAVPVSLVRLEWDHEALGTIINFQVGSNGLASGNHLPEALTAGLLELIERDAVACQQVARQVLNVPAPKVRLDTIQSEPVRYLLRQFQAAQVKPLLFDMTVDTQIPVFQAIIYDQIDPGAATAAGYGAHLDPEIAMIRALTEAAQSRVVLMAGSRDEHFRHHHALFKKFGGTSRVEPLDSIPESVDMVGYRSQATMTFEGDIAVILKQLRASGLNRAIVFDLTLPGFEISVVRVVVPGLEGYMFAYYKAGLRARAFARQKKARHSLTL